MARVMIDPGHGPGNANRGPTGYYEYAGMWKLSNYLKTALERCGIDADLTRKENDTPSLELRGYLAKDCDVFLSEHSNAHNGKVRRVTVFYSIRMKGDAGFAADLAKAVGKVFGHPDNAAKATYKESTNTKGADYYTVIYAAEATNCKHVFMIENGFHDNREDEAILKQDAKLKAIAEAQAQVVCRYLGIVYKPEEAPKPAVAKPATPDTIKGGDIVTFIGGPIFSASTDKTPANNKGKSRCKVTGVAAGAPHPYHLISEDAGGVYGWVNANCIAGATSNTVAKPAAPAKPKAEPVTFKPKDKVKLKSGVTRFANGVSIWSPARKWNYIVRQVNGNKVLISTLPIGPTTGWVYMDDLIARK